MSTYEEELYALVRALKSWEHYLLSKEFVLLIDHFSLKYLKSQTNISRSHVRWISYLLIELSHAQQKKNRISTLIATINM